MEEWRSIPGFEGSYEISNFGTVRSIDRQIPKLNRWGTITVRTEKGQVLRWVEDNNGYPKVTLCYCGKRYFRYVHRLVCMAFHGLPPKGTYHAAHNDGNPKNPSASNVRWATPKENAKDKIMHGTLLSGARNGNAKLSLEQVNEIRASGGVTRKALGEKFGVAPSTISMIWTGRNWVNQ